MNCRNHENTPQQSDSTKKSMPWLRQSGFNPCFDKYRHLCKQTGQPETTQGSVASQPQKGGIPTHANSQWTFAVTSRQLTDAHRRGTSGKVRKAGRSEELLVPRNLGAVPRRRRRSKAAHTLSHLPRRRRIEETSLGALLYWLCCCGEAVFHRASRKQRQIKMYGGRLISKTPTQVFRPNGHNHVKPFRV